MPCVEDKNRGGKKGKKKNEILSQFFYNFFTINFKGRLLLANIGEKKNNFFRKRKK